MRECEKVRESMSVIYCIACKGYPVKKQINIIPIDKNGRELIQRMLHLVNGLKVDFTTDTIQSEELKRVLLILQSFPYIEIITIILEILRFYSSEPHKTYILLKFLEVIKTKNKVLGIKINTTKVLTVLFWVFFLNYGLYGILGNYVLHLIKLFLSDKNRPDVDTLLKNLLKEKDCLDIFYLNVLYCMNQLNLIDTKFLSLYKEAMSNIS